eukprot:TRINITY_DN12910_c0_g1_i1.p1 TRINITY_DN12910_c0_g1~~TRINITY_DN12910_c0_g1_i1.p1  ORF type:complete len:275 (-),score=51.84 TRINITY_DN12910_c0_g1_i1:82-906(-)
MGADHSFHLERCSSGFQMEYRELMLKWHKAQRGYVHLRGTGAHRQAVDIDNNIKATLNECWEMAGENYPAFEEFVISVEDDLLCDIEKMEMLARQGRGGMGNSMHGQMGGSGQRGGMGNSMHGHMDGYGGKGHLGGRGIMGGRGGRGGVGSPCARSGGAAPAGWGEFRGSGAYRDEFIMRDSYNMDAHHHHAATVHGVLHCRGGKPLRVGQPVKVLFGEMRGCQGRIAAMDSNPRTGEHMIIVQGADRYGNEWQEEFDASRNEYGQFVFPVHGL